MRRLPVLALVLAAVTAASLLGSASSPATAAATSSVAATPVGGHPYSDPLYYPLRDAAKVTCVKTNCTKSSGGYYHDFWAIDFVGTKGSPVYAAGAGVFHVGANQPGCAVGASSSEVDGGVWGWIDHGGGRTTRYYHLSSLTAANGQYVTPATQVGTMGNSGDAGACATMYLHFEVRDNGFYGTRVAPRQLTACVGGTAVRFPSALAGAHSSWDDVVKSTQIPATTSSCIVPMAAGTTERPSGFSVTRGNARATLRWGAPSRAADQVKVLQEIYRPSLGRYSTGVVYRALSGSARSLTVTGLENGRKYRYRMAFHTPSGYSAWSPAVEVVPATVPSRPRTVRWLLSSRTGVRFAWWKSVEHGSAVTKYEAQIRHVSSGRWTSWKRSYVSRTTYRKNWVELRRGTTYQVRVRAISGLGKTSWSPAYKIRTKR